MKLKFIVCKPGSADWTERRNRVQAIYSNGGQQAGLQWRHMLEKGQLFKDSSMI